ncbi:MAG: hypothetical protein WA997_01145, partial [Anaerolineales bacterium]
MSSSNFSIGLPRMHLEPGEKRVFLPEFIAELQKIGFEVFLEHEYGSSIGLTEQDYLKFAERTKFTNLEQIYQQDHILVLRYPGDELVRMIKPGA